jgi:hypothetical protein
MIDAFAKQHINEPVEQSVAAQPLTIAS